MSAPSPNIDGRPQRPAWRPSRKALLIAAAAFAVGLLLFGLLWLDQRNNNDFYRADGVQRSAEGQQFEPLPAPLPASESGASGMGDVDQQIAPEDQSRIVAAPPSAPVAPSQLAAPVAPVPSAAMADSDVPQPVSTPAPRYPREAQRRGESGTVLLRVHVDPGGMPYAVDLVQSSHSRALDRAASEAVRRWRFRPAMRDGQPIAGIVQVPVTFNLQP